MSVALPQSVEINTIGLLKTLTSPWPAYYGSHLVPPHEPDLCNVSLVVGDRDSVTYTQYTQQLQVPIVLG